MGSRGPRRRGKPKIPMNRTRSFSSLKRRATDAAGCWSAGASCGSRSRTSLNRGGFRARNSRRIRLLGKQPLDAVCDNEVALVFLASHAICSELRSCLSRATVRDSRESSSRTSMAELERDELEAITPADAAAGRAALLEIIDKAIERLRRLEAEHAGSRRLRRGAG